MPTLSKQQTKIIATAIKNQRPEIKATRVWLGLVAEFSIGRVDGNKINFTRSDYQQWRELLISSCGFDPTTTELTGNRTEVSRITHQEKWAPESELKKQLSVTALGGDLITTQGRCAVIPQVDYRVNKAYLKPQDYNACLVVENFEAFVFIHQFNLPTLGHVLVLYRGHDLTARSVNEFLADASDTPIIGFTDPDPAGLGILNDWPWLSHALIPKLTDLKNFTDIPSLHDRFISQLRKRPNLREECADKPQAYRDYANWILNAGFAGSQEWLCSHGVGLEVAGF
ncbi:DUF7281 domain-containing protein [Marinagarivorans cellulosilyticus]|uniref:DUF7281 domain-containing protein n=1 Tax=Marinagarivorans cellulosilyticus TaxID=2721545 RepID=A0AAN1WJA6_9GAMM|nr:hypothetical protein [Marinagarivorans cellulosilyticus]BCD98650.1 hypothetical protein MARGE09_P2851 [Marinagarivorans cellulosilyticus]